VDRVPFWEWGPWPTTLKRWEREGFPKNADFAQYFELDPQWKRLYINFRFIPQFKKRVISDNGKVRVIRDERGIILKELSVETDTSMPQFLEYPVKCRKDFEKLKKRLNPHAPQRYPPERLTDDLKLKNRDFPLGIIDWTDSLGFFGVIRDWVGAENLLYMFYDDLYLVQEMLEYLTDFFITILKKVPLQEIQLDYVSIWEDMAFRGGPLISPQMFREFVLPCYKKLTTFLRDRGVKTIMVDSDGNIEELIPLWLEGGVNVFYPLEIASGMDPVKLSKKYGQDVILVGGIDKRALAKGKQAIEKELAAKISLIEKGGYIPTVDHSIPPDISFGNFCYYMKLKRTVITGKET